MQSDDVKRLKQLEAENARLKKLLAERDLEIEVIDERSLQKSGERAGSPCPGGICDGQGPVVALVWPRPASIAAAAGLHADGGARSALAYQSVNATKDAPVLARMAELSAEYPRYGYRRIAIFLARDGHPMSFGRAHRLWRRAQLQVPRKRPRKRIATGRRFSLSAHHKGSRPRPKAPTGANQVWSYDFVFDACANGQQLKCLTVTDEWTKEGLAIEVDGCIRSGRVIKVLARLVSERGAPLYSCVRTTGRNRCDACLIAASKTCQPSAVEMDCRSRHYHGVDRSRQTLADCRDARLIAAYKEWHGGELQRQIPRKRTFTR